MIRHILVILQSSNFFAALDDSDDENKGVTAAKKDTGKASKKKRPEVVEPSKVDDRYVSFRVVIHASKLKKMPSLLLLWSGCPVYPIVLLLYLNPVFGTP